MKVEMILSAIVMILIFSMTSCSNEDPCDKWKYHRGAPTQEMIEDCA